MSTQIEDNSIAVLLDELRDRVAAESRLKVAEEIGVAYYRLGNFARARDPIAGHDILTALLNRYGYKIVRPVEPVEESKQAA